MCLRLSQMKSQLIEEQQIFSRIFVTQKLAHATVMELSIHTKDSIIGMLNLSM